jgi:lipopolysaccharide export system protein LptC
MAAELTEAEEKARPDLASRAMERRAAEMERWRRRSRRIVFYRQALPWTMLAIVVAVAAWVGLRAYLSARQLDMAAATSAIHMTNPKFYGRDNKGRSFQLTAKDAVRDAHDNNIVNLHDPGMMLDSGGKQPVKVQGGSGVYRDDTKMLDLAGGVTLQDGRGSEFRSATASVDTRAGVVTGQKDVYGQGPLGRIAASSYAVHESGARVIFSGNVHTHIENH